jgi:MFS family permease
MGGGLMACHGNSIDESPVRRLRFDATHLAGEVPLNSAKAERPNPAGFPPATLAWSVWGLAALLYLLGFYQRVAPAVITHELRQEFSLSATALGHLSAFYFYAYVAVQIPTGLLADRWGPRRLLTLGTGAAAFGMLAFGLARDLTFATMGRALVGAGVGVAYVAMLKIASVWLPPHRFTLAAALALAVGMVGATFAGAPLRALVDSLGWREVMAASAAFAALLTVAIWLVVRDDPTERDYLSYGHAPPSHEPTHVLDDLRAIFRYRNTWLILLMPGSITAILLSFAGLWGVPFLVTHYPIDTRTAALFASLVMLGWAAGSILIAPLSDRAGRRKPLYVASLVAVMIVWCVLIFVPRLPIAILAAACFLLGFTGGAFTIGFAWAKESVPPRYAGTMGGIANVGSMIGPMFGQPIVGWVLDLRGMPATTSAGVRIYDLAAYQVAFGCLLIWSVLSVVLALCARETYCEQTID